MPIPLGILAVAGAGGGALANSYELLTSTIVTTPFPSSITFSNLDTYTDYKHLQLRIVNQVDTASTNTEDLRIRFNGDTGFNYAAHSLNGNGGSVVVRAINGNDQIVLNETSVGQNDPNAFVAAIIDILDFSSTTKNKTIRCLAGIASTENDVVLNSGFWNNTNALTSIQLYVTGRNFVTGSRFSLYGIKG